MKLEVIKIKNGPFKQNCYLVIAENGEALLIDPGSDAKRIKAKLSEEGVLPVAVLNTHAHFDHIGAVAEICIAYDIPFYLHKADARLLSQANLYVKVFGCKQPIKVPAAFQELSEENSPFTVGTFQVEIIDVPGHTQGSVCIKLGGNVFVGDTVLANGIGRTDLPGGNKEALLASICKLKKILPSHCLLWPGHGRSFKIEDVKTAGAM